MGSQGLEHSLRDIHILVTGYGLFHEHAANPSWLLAASLPPSITYATGRIYIHTLPGPVEVCYKRVRDTVPGLLFSRYSSNPNYDIVLHIGLADTRDYYSIESQAYRDGYDKEDATGHTLKGDTFWKSEFQSPPVLKTSINIYNVLKKCKQILPGEDLRVSDDAGRYLCEFIYYTSMVEYWRKDPEGDRPVVFLHVPKRVDRESLEIGKEVVLGFITSLVETNV
ncbi:hypothetical protein F5884DRAFT_795838 [Xylogone sp. PMI_703]|nr:hypothetical protein F5884DRAFT_795838 [Xylogone sp. PMI_703]